MKPSASALVGASRAIACCSRRLATGVAHAAGDQASPSIETLFREPQCGQALLDLTAGASQT